MTRYVLGINPCISGLGVHNPSAAILADGTVEYAVEEDRFTREKQAFNTFPTESITRCLDHCNIEFSALNEIAIPWEPTLLQQLFRYNLSQTISGGNGWRKAEKLQFAVKRGVLDQFGYSMRFVREQLREFGEPLPSIRNRAHHRCHAASVTHLAKQDVQLVVTLDGRGEHDATAVWDATGDKLERIRTYQFPNSLGFLYGMVTEFLGFQSFHGEGKVMGLAPYGEYDADIDERLRSVVTAGVDYDVTGITATAANDLDDGVQRLESLFDRPRKSEPSAFSDWEKNLAYIIQAFVEETVTDIVRTYTHALDTGKVGLAGGVALNCKLNKAVMELPEVEDVFIQPVAHDSGSALGAAALSYEADKVKPMGTPYWGDQFTCETITAKLDEFGIEYRRPDDLVEYVADRLADGDIVGWFQGRQEHGPRALCNRSILADPRSESSRKRVNASVKHRESWRPFAPVIRRDAAETYLVDAEDAPYMIKTFDVRPETREEIPATLHPADETTRPQTVTKDQNERICALLTAFEARTGVPVLLNTSFNDHGEPIVRTPREAIRDFFSTGLDLLVLEDVLVEK